MTEDDKIDYTKLKKEIDNLFKKKILKFNGIFKKKFCINRQGLLKEIESKLLAKLKRTKEKIDTKKKFNDIEIKMSIETGFRSGFYIHFREIMNEAKFGKVNISREKEAMNVMTLKELRETKVDMFTTVFIGNSQTKNLNGKMVTPRGYKNV